MRRKLKFPNGQPPEESQVATALSCACKTSYSEFG
jgi:hypothetical protein